MPPPHRPSKPEAIVCSKAYEVAIQRCERSGNETGLSMSDMTWGMMEAFRELDRAGYDIVDRRTGEVVEYVYGHIPYTD